MLIRPAELEAIKAGRLDLAFRRWDRPRLLVGTQMRTAVGLIEVTSVDQIPIADISDAEAVLAGAGSRAEVLARLDNHVDRPVFRIGLRFAGPDPRVALRDKHDLGDDERTELLAALARLDVSSRTGAWTQVTLESISHSPGTRAADLAAALGSDLISFKRNVRKLKELGLTESLETGYRLSPRGRTVLAAMR